MARITFPSAGRHSDPGSDLPNPKSVIADFDFADAGGAENHFGAVRIVNDKVGVIDPAEDDRWFAVGDECRSG